MDEATLERMRDEFSLAQTEFQYAWVPDLVDLYPVEEYNDHRYWKLSLRDVNVGLFSIQAVNHDTALYRFHTSCRVEFWDFKSDTMQAWEANFDSSKTKKDLPKVARRRGEILLEWVAGFIGIDLSTFVKIDR